jgi:hypothetical protein
MTVMTVVAVIVQLSRGQVYIRRELSAGSRGPTGIGKGGPDGDAKDDPRLAEELWALGQETLTKG